MPERSKSAKTRETLRRRRAAIIGGGVIGGGWAARFLLHGWDVRVFDPDPNAERKIAEVLANAERSLPLLSDVSMPTRGELTFAPDIKTAVADVEWVQESVPERLEIKHSTFTEIFKHLPAAALVGSSTSGFKPSELQQVAASAGFEANRILVAHPFNPVYLLPLVELVAGDAGLDSSTRQAEDLLIAIGMKPLKVRKEIDAHIADRFLEAVWREGLWLIKDDIATTEEIDDAIRYGFGLRWAQMGLFETYRIAGGEAGMKHFIAQFGPCLSWPWTKLMDVPELDDALVEKIAGQSDAQSGQYSIRELERVRDDNLVGILQALKQRHWGAGNLLLAHDEALRKIATPSAANNRIVPDSDRIAEASALQLTRGTVLPGWLDFNGHMTEFRYLEVFSQASDALFESLGIGPDSVEQGFSVFTIETHMQHLSELVAGSQWHTTTQVLWSDDKRIRVFHSLFSGSAQQPSVISATCEQMFMHIDMNARASCPFAEPLMSQIRSLVDAHSSLEKPLAAGQGIGQSLSEPG